jgi:uncharacterized FlaG/YvyC family protein
MEVGNIPKFEQYANFSPTKVEEVQPTHSISLLNEEVKNRNIDHPDLVKELQEAHKNSATKENTAATPAMEFIISNVNFGYNPQSKDFFVKVNRSDYVAQYPTDEMMKLKAYLMNLSQGIA